MPNFVINTTDTNDNGSKYLRHFDTWMKLNSKRQRIETWTIISARVSWKFHSNTTSPLYSGWKSSGQLTVGLQSLRYYTTWQRRKFSFSKDVFIILMVASTFTILLLYFLSLVRNTRTTFLMQKFFLFFLTSLTLCVAL